MKYTLSFHQEGDDAKQGHNRRAGHSISKKGGIDLAKSGKNIILVDTPIREAYDKLFSASVAEFNSRQKNHDRIINSYYDKINQDPKKHNVYEIIVQLGSKVEGAPDNADMVLMNYAIGFEDRNPNLKVVGAYLHMDEATPHLHLDYIPVAESKRGMRYQVSMTGALKAQGFKTKCYGDTAQIKWEAAERKYIRDLCRQMHVSLHDEGVGKKRHLSVPEYKELQDRLNALKEQVQFLDAQLQQKKDTLSGYDKKLHDSALLDSRIKEQIHVLDRLREAENLLSWNSYWERVYDRIPSHMKGVVDQILQTNKDFYCETIQPMHEEISNALDDLDTALQYIDEELSL